VEGVRKNEKRVGSWLAQSESSRNVSAMLGVGSVPLHRTVTRKSARPPHILTDHLQPKLLSVDEPTRFKQPVSRQIRECPAAPALTCHSYLQPPQAALRFSFGYPAVLRETTRIVRWPTQSSVTDSYDYPSPFFDSSSSPAANSSKPGFPTADF
jgi:hypothetical protein